MVVSNKGILAFLPQTGPIRSPVTPLSSPSGYGSDSYCRGHCLAASRIPTRKRATTRRRRTAAGGLTMRQTKEEEAKTKMRLRCAVVQRCCYRSSMFYAEASKRIVSKRRRHAHDYLDTVLCDSCYKTRWPPFIRHSSPSSRRPPANTSLHFDVVRTCLAAMKESWNRLIF